MSKIKCSVISSHSKKVAKELGISEATAQTLVSTWQSINSTSNYPNMKQAKELWEKDSREIELSIPLYVDKPYEEGMLAGTSSDGTITLYHWWEKGGLDLFFDYIQGSQDSNTSKQKQEVFNRLAKEGYTLDRIRELIQEPLDANMFLLWHEMSHVQQGDSVVYWAVEKSKYPNWDTMSKEEKDKLRDYLTPDKIEIEYRATKEALRKLELYKKNNPTVSKPKTSNTINIWYSSNENADLSNFAIRPFYAPAGFDANFSTKFQTVEGAFQAQKLAFANIPIEEKEKINEQLAKASGASAKRIGRSIPNLNKSEWDKVSSGTMKMLILDSFKENPQALQRLLSTGDAVLTHVQESDNSKWKTEFPRLLMEVREELRGQALNVDRAIPVKNRKTYSGMVTSLKDNQIFVFGSNTEGRHGMGAAATAKRLFGAKQFQAEGLQGQSYAIITKDLTKDDRKNPSRTKEQIKEQIHKLYEFARQNPDKEFLVAYSKDGKNLNYYSNKDMAEMFASEEIPSNIVFEEGFNSLVFNTASINDTVQDNSIRNLGKDYSMYSGNAKGSDKYWRAIAKQYGIGGEDFTPEKLTDEQREEARPKIDEANKSLHRVFPMEPNDKRNKQRTDYSNDLVYRDWLQVKNADTIFAIGKLKGGIVEGGTGWAVQMAINEGKPVYVFSNGKWYSNTDGKWKSSDIPILTPNFAGIGTEDLDEAGKQAIRDVFTKTFGIAPSNIEESTNKNITVRTFGDSASYDDVMNQYYGQVKPASPSNTSNTTPTISDFSEIESALNAMYQSSAEESSYEYKEELPTVGDNAISVNRDNANAEALRLFSVQKRKDRASLLARQFSEQLDIAYEELMDNLREELNEAIQDADADKIADITTKMDKYNHPEDGRKAVMEAITVEVILDRIKETYKEWLQQSKEELDANYGKGKGEYLLSEYQKVLDYFNFLLEDAALEIEKREGIRLVLSRHSYNNGSKEIEVIGGRAENNTNEDSIADQEDSEDEVERRENSDGLGIIKARTVDPHSTVSKRVKRILSSILKEDFEGNIETDDLGEYRYLDEEHAHAVLISELSSMIDSDDFSTIDEATREIVSLPALEKLVPKYPWVNQIINYIYADNDAASKFFADFRKEFIHYYQISEEKRFAVNEELGKDTLYNEAVSNYDSGTKLTDKAVYNADSTVNKEKAKEAVIFTDNTINKIKGIRSLTDEGINALALDISEVMKSLGIDISGSYINTLLETEEGIAELKNSLYSAKKIFSEIDSLDDSIHLIDAMKEEYEKIAEILGVVKENGYVASSRIGDATMYSYSSSNYLDGMIKSFKRDDRRDVYLNNEYKKYKWFYEGGKWKNEWLRIIETNNSAREMLETMELKNINGLDYEEWSPNVVRAEFIKQYFSAGYSSSSKTQYAWYNFPIFSDSPLVKFIKFVRYTGDYEAQITPLLRQVVKQELERMKLVKDRKAKGIPTITNFDKNGEKFHFFPELNNDSEFIDAVNKATEEADINRLDAIIDTKIKSLMDTLYQDFYNNSYYLLSEIKPVLESNGEISTQEELDDKIREYFWNSVFATTQIIQLTTTDLAYYKNQVDFQKRFKEVYGSGTKLNTNSKYGKKTEKTVYISDEIVTSFSYDEIKKVLESNPNLSKTDREMILTKYRNINVTDAQAYRSPQSFRAVLDMMGVWTDDMERTFQRMEKGEWNIVDFNTVWQTIKPFLYTQIEKPDGLGGVMKVPHQNKNSEFLLLSMYGMIASGIKGSPKLRAINRFMKDFDIDVIQFESAVKVGGQGIINLNYSEEKLAKITNLSYDKFKEAMDKDLDNHKITREEYQEIFDSIAMNEEDVYNTLRDNTANGTNPYTVHELPYKDYVVQQPTPEHLFDALAVFGSQFRNLIVSDISDNAEFTVNGKKYNKQELLNLYQALIVENLLDSFEEVRKEFGTESIESLQGALLNQVKGNPKYGRDIVEALQIVEIKHPLTGDTIKVFNIPLSNPTTTNIIQELINSTFKNRITKQKIKGGNCIMVTSYGLTEDLQLRYDDNGNLLGAECYLPASSKEFYEPFMVTKTKIVRGEKVEYKELDVKKLKKAGLDKMVGYRIPTENKYSMLPLIVKGFLPQQNGSAIMLPADITTISGADFDVKHY